MLASQIPAKFPVAWASGAGSQYVRDIPVTSQIGVTVGRASFVDGFVPASFIPVTNGGTPPAGKDFNGILKAITLWLQWQCAGGMPSFDASFCTTIGGYPQGALLASTVPGQVWLNLIDANTTNPDASTAADWTAVPTATAIQANQYTYGRDHGVQSALSVTLPDVEISVLSEGMGCRVLALTACAGATTLTLNGLGPKPIVGSGGIALANNAFAAGDILDLTYTSAGAWQLSSVYGSGGSPVRLHAAADAAVSVLATDEVVATSVALTAPRTWVLPAAASVTAGKRIALCDFFGTVSSTNTLTIACSGSDTINGQSSELLTTPYFQLYAYSDGVSRWSFQFVDPTQVLGLGQIIATVAGQGAQISGLLSSVSSLAIALAQLRRDTAAQIAALQAALTALSTQQVTAAAPGSVFSVVDMFTDTSGLTVSASTGASVGSGLTFPQATKNPISYFPLVQYASNLKVINNRYLTAPYTEAADGGNGRISAGNNGYAPAPTSQYVANQLGPWNVTPQVEGFAVQRTRFGASLAVQSAAAIQSSTDPSQLFGSSSYPLAYSTSWLPWTSYSPEINHQNGLWRDLSARGFWGIRAADAPTGNLVAVSQVFQADTDDMITSFRLYRNIGQGDNASLTPGRLLVCEELNGVPDPNNVVMDITGRLIDSSNSLWNGFYSDLFTLPYPLLRKAGQRYHFVAVYPASTGSILTTSKASTPDPSMKTFLVMNANGSWAQDPNNNQMTCTYSRANFTQGTTPVELNTVSLNGGIDNLDFLTPIIMPTGCDAFYGTFTSGGSYNRLAPINPTDSTTNPLASRPTSLRIAVEIVPTGRTAPIIDMAPTSIGSTVSTAARRAGTLTAQSAVRAPVNMAGAPISVTKITQVVTLQNFNPAIHTFTETLGTGASYGTSTNPTSVSGPVMQSDGTVQFTFSWALTTGVTTFVANYSGTTSDVTQTFTITKSITTAAP